MSPRVIRTLPLVEPILLTRRREPFDDPTWLFEPKYDGYRGLLYVTRQGCHFRSKRGNILNRFEQLCYWVREELPVKEAILDGEVVALDNEGRQNFRDLLAGRGNLHYAAFDTLWIRGRDHRGLPLTRRKRALSGLIPATTTVLSQVFSIGAEGAICSTLPSGSTWRGSWPSERRMLFAPRRCGTRSRAVPTRKAKVGGSYFRGRNAAQPKGDTVVALFRKA
jgi:hypothetical protein